MSDEEWKPPKVRTWLDIVSRQNTQLSWSFQTQRYEAHGNTKVAGPKGDTKLVPT